MYKQYNIKDHQMQNPLSMATITLLKSNLCVIKRMCFPKLDNLFLISHKIITTRLKYNNTIHWVANISKFSTYCISYCMHNLGVIEPQLHHSRWLFCTSCVVIMSSSLNKWQWLNNIRALQREDWLGINS